LHKYLRAIGFSKIKSHDELQKLIDKTIDDPSECKFSVYKDDILYGDYSLFVGDNIGLTVCGEYTPMDDFITEHYYPYMVGSKISTSERSIVERQAANVAFAGLVEDNKVGISIIYYLLNRVDYIRYSFCDPADARVAPVRLSGLSINGTIMMPIAKDAVSINKSQKGSKKRDKLIKAAREGSEEALESLTLDDLDVYSTISRKIKETDVYTIVDTCFMPYGIECDQYSILGEIEELKEVKNTITGEELFQMGLRCNGIYIDICINKKDLYGEPKVGRRFKGNVWLQGILDIGSHS